MGGLRPSVPSGFKPYGLSIVGCEFESRSELEGWLLGGKLDGWLCCTGEVRAWKSSEQTLPRGVPLSGEFVSQTSDLARVSFALRRSTDRWVLHEYRESGFGELRAEDRSYISTEAGRSMQYRIYWRAGEEDEIQIWRPYVARFRGWETSQ